MKIKVDEIGKRIQVDITPSEYFVRACETEDEKFSGTHVLVHKIDMSYKGKPPQEGAPVLFLNQREYEKVRGLIDELL